jgi:TonB family protein
MPASPAAVVSLPSEPRKRLSAMIISAIALVAVLAVSGYLLSRRHTGTERNAPETAISQKQAANAQLEQQEKDLFAEAKVAQEAKQWDHAIALYNQVADLHGSMQDQARQAIPIVQALRQGTAISKIEQDTFAEGSRALKMKDYFKADSLFQHVIELKVPDSQLAPQAQAEREKIAPVLQAKKELDAAAAAQNAGDVKGALARYQAIASGGGPFQADAQTRIQQINEQLNAGEARQQFDAADKAQTGGDLNGALAQFKALAAKSGPFQSQAQQRVQAITDLLAAAADKQKFDAADRAQSSGDLKGALAQFKSLADRAGPMQAQAQDRQQQVAQLLAAANKPKAPSNATPATTAARNPVVQLLPSGPFQAWTRPIQKGQIVPDNSVDGGLRPINDAVPPLPNAPAGAYVVFTINIDNDGNVKPVRYLSDDNGLSPQVMAAAKEWKFNPPTVKGKPVSTSISVKITF